MMYENGTLSHSRTYRAGEGKREGRRHSSGNNRVSVRYFSICAAVSLSLAAVGLLQLQFSRKPLRHTRTYIVILLLIAMGAFAVALSA
jgi:hypothetical protein